MTLEQQREQVRIDLAAMFRLTAHLGWDDTIWNHITARVPGEGNRFYMHRFGLGYDEVTASNLIVVDEEGNVIEGPEDVNTTGSSSIVPFTWQRHTNTIASFFTLIPRARLHYGLQEVPFFIQDSSMLYGKLAITIGKAYRLTRMSATVLPPISATAVS